MLEGAGVRKYEGGQLFNAEILYVYVNDYFYTMIYFTKYIGIPNLRRK